MSDNEEIENIIRDMCDKNYALGLQHMDEQSIFIRPSGNPLNIEGWKSMMTSEDVIVEKNDLISINKLYINGNMAFVCYTTHGKFNYKGTENDDIAVLTSILEKKNKTWKILLSQRSTGRTPNDELPKF